MAAYNGDGYRASRDTTGFQLDVTPQKPHYRLIISQSVLNVKSFGRSIAIWANRTTCEMTPGAQNAGCRACSPGIWALLRLTLRIEQRLRVHCPVTGLQPRAYFHELGLRTDTRGSTTDTQSTYHDLWTYR